jgi:tetrahydromethanopterin S-methyltransferase subunit G
MNIQHRLEEIARRVGLTWDEVKDLTLAEFVAKVQARTAGPQ